jgi:hypothetical protein
VPPSPPPKKKKKKKAPTTAVTAWPNQWTNLASEAPQQQQWDWDPESAERWDKDVRQTAAKEKIQHGRMTSWIPFLNKSKSQPVLNKAAKKFARRRHRRYSDSDSDDSSSEEDSDSDDEDWRERERRKWANTPHGTRVGAGAAAAAAAQHNIADFISNGNTPIVAPAVMASSAEQGQPVLPGWSFPGAQAQWQSPRPWTYPNVQSQSPQPWGHRNAQSPQPWANAQSPQPWANSQSPQPWAYAYPHQHRRSTPAPSGLGMNEVTGKMNALGLYGV